MQAADAGFRVLTSPEVVMLIFSIITYLVLFLAGRAILHQSSPIALNAPAGLAVGYSFFIILSLFFPGFSMILPFYAVFFLAVVGCFKRIKGLKFEMAMFSASLAMLAPLIYLAVINNNPLWDDFTNWLPPASYLLEYNHLPTLDKPDLTRSTFSYPFSRAMFHAWIAKFSGEFNVNVQGVLNMLFASSFLLWAHELIKKQCEVQDNISAIKSYLPLMGLLGASLTIWILTLNTRLVLGSFADPALSLSLASLLIYLSYSKNVESRFWKSRIDPNLCLLLLFPYFIKDTAVYFVTILFFCFWLSRLSKANFQSFPNCIRTAKKLAINALHFTPLFLFVMIWNIYCKQNGLSAPITLNSINSWNFEFAPEILKSMLSQSLGRPYLLVGFLLAILLISKKWDSNFSSSKIRCVIVPALIFSIAMYVFFFIAYLGAFDKAAASRATAFSRYIAPSGFLIWVALIVYWVKQQGTNIRKSFNLICVALFLSFIGIVIIKADKFVVSDTQAPLKQAAKTIQEIYPNSKKLLIVDALSSGIDYVSIRYYLGRKYYTRVEGRQYYARVEGLTWRPNGVPMPELRLLLKNYDDVFIYSAPKSLLESIQQIQDEK